MAMPPLTLANIQPHLSDIAYKALAEVYDDDKLEQLSKPEGLNLEVEKLPSNVRMGWHRDQADSITGIFLRIYSQEFLQAYTFSQFNDPDVGLKKQVDYLVVINQFTTPYMDKVINKQEADRIFACLTGDPHKEAIDFQVQPQETPEVIQNFFQTSPTMLPSPLREQLFPEPPKSLKKEKGEANSSNETSYFYIAGGLLLLLGAAYIAKQYFGKSKQQH